MDEMIEDALLEALEAEVQRAKDDDDLIATLRRLAERDRDILDRLAE